MLIQIALFDGFDPLDVIGPYEVFMAASLATERPITVELASAEGRRRVPSGSGSLALDATTALDPDRLDVLVVPGAAGRSGEPTADPPDPDSVPSRLAATLATGLPGAIEATLQRPEAIVACVCGGTLIPAMAGLIEHRPASTHHLGLDLLDATGVEAVTARVVDDGNLVSAGGVTSGLDLALHLVERLIGARIAHAVERLFEFERRGTIWRAQGPQPVPV